MKILKICLLGLLTFFASLEAFAQANCTGCPMTVPITGGTSSGISGNPSLTIVQAPDSSYYLFQLMVNGTTVDEDTIFISPSGTFTCSDCDATNELDTAGINLTPNADSSQWVIDILTNGNVTDSKTLYIPNTGGNVVCADVIDCVNDSMRISQTLDIQLDSNYLTTCVYIGVTAHCSTIGLPKSESSKDSFNIINIFNLPDGRDSVTIVKLDGSTDTWVDTRLTSEEVLTIVSNNTTVSTTNVVNGDSTTITNCTTIGTETKCDSTTIYTGGQMVFISNNEYVDSTCLVDVNGVIINCTVRDTSGGSGSSVVTHNVTYNTNANGDTISVSIETLVNGIQTDTDDIIFPNGLNCEEVLTCVGEDFTKTTVTTVIGDSTKIVDCLMIGTETKCDSTTIYTGGQKVFLDDATYVDSTCLVDINGAIINCIALDTSGATVTTGDTTFTVDGTEVNVCELIENCQILQGLVKNVSVVGDSLVVVYQDGSSKSEVINKGVDSVYLQQVVNPSDNSDTLLQIVYIKDGNTVEGTILDVCAGCKLDCLLPIKADSVVTTDSSIIRYQFLIEEGCQYRTIIDEQKVIQDIAPNSDTTFISTQEYLLSGTDTVGIVKFITEGNYSYLDTTYFPSQNVDVHLIEGGYSVLRSLNSDSLESIIVLADWTSTYEGKTFLQKGGLFEKDLSALALGDNGATTIVANDLQGWKRVFDGKHFSPHWVELGGLDHNGNPVIDNTSDNGVQSVADAVRSVVQIAPHGAVIEYMDYTYEYDRYIPNKNRQTHKGTAKGNNFQGGTIITRPDIIGAVLTSGLGVGTSSFSVDNPSAFKVGQIVNAYKGKGRQDEVSGCSSTFQGDGHEITAISGNTLTLSSPSRVAFSAGDSVIVTPLFYFRENSLNALNFDNQYVTFEGISFDGKRSDGYSAIKAYSVMGTIIHWDGMLTIRDCYFRDTPTENLESASAHIENCTYKSLGGSFFHGSGDSETMDSSEHGIFIINLKGDSSNINPSWDFDDNQHGTGHSEGLFTFSARVKKLTIQGGEVSNGGDYLIGHMNQDDIEITVKDLRARNFDGIFSTRSTITDLQTGYLFENNFFDNCGIIEIVAGDARKAQGIRYFNYKNNTSINTKIFFEGVVDVDISGNNIDFDSVSLSNKGGFYEFIPEGSAWAGNAYQSAISFACLSDRINISNNKIRGLNYDENDLRYAIHIINFDGTRVRLDENGNPTNTIYLQDLKVHGNVFEDFENNFVIDGQTNKSFDYQVANWTFTNNSIVTKRNLPASGRVIGLSCVPGQIVNNNIIYVVPDASNAWGINAHGVTLAQRDSLYGPLVENNKIYFKRFAKAITVGFADANAHHVMVIDNNFFGGANGVSAIRADAPIGGAGSQNYEDNNTHFHQNIFPNLVAYPQPPYTQRVYENSSQY